MGFLEDVASQGAALRTLTGHYRRSVGELGIDLAAVLPASPRSIVFTGMGTSLHVALAVRHRLSVAMGVPVLVVDAGELVHFGVRGIAEDDVIIAVSQSGESIETLRVVESLEDHAHLVTLTNNADSPMARMARLNLDMLAGQEAAISTKTYTNALALVLLLAKAMCGDDIEQMLASLDQVSKEMDRVRHAGRSETEDAAAHLRPAASLHFIARGPALAAAAQAALTFQEGVHIHASWMSGGEFRHGPMELAGDGHHAVVFAPDGAAGDLLRDLASELGEAGSRVVLFTSARVAPLENLVQVDVPFGAPELFALSVATHQELLLDQMARDRGRVAGVFERGEKVTRRE